MTPDSSPFGQRVLSYSTSARVSSHPLASASSTQSADRNWSRKTLDNTSGVIVKYNTKHLSKSQHRDPIARRLRRDEHEIPSSSVVHRSDRVLARGLRPVGGAKVIRFIEGSGRQLGRSRDYSPEGFRHGREHD